MPNIEELMDIVGQTISERKQEDVFYNNGSHIRIWTTSIKRKF